MSKKILVLGAGMVARPIVDYLLGRPENYELTIADVIPDKAAAIVAGRPRGRAVTLDIADAAALSALVAAADVVVSILPYTLHAEVAKHCLARRRSLVTTSYVSPAMRALDDDARAAGVLFLNETGLDPGIDHMSAMRVIREAQRRGGRVLEFRSFCGGLPAPDANDNPWGYKFSWSPRGVVLAGRNAARYLEDGLEINVPGEVLFSDVRPIVIPGAGEFEFYPNRDSLPYMEIYGLEGTRTVFRGTLRYQGWCDTWLKLAALGFLHDDVRTWGGKSYRDFTREVIGAGADVEREFALRARVPFDGDVIRRATWLGLFGNDAVPLEDGAPLDVLAARLLEKCSYGPGERDMVILYHDFLIAYGDRRERVTSTLVDFGVPGGDSAMSRTVSYPAAVAAHLVASGELKLTGVQIPVLGEIYDPILAELETLGIHFEERTGAP
jgi:saccharopine dehydrogenase (NADP+, L-glutamate forming)